LREKMVEMASAKFICIVDESKLCRRLGPGFPLPVEITPFCHENTIRGMQAIPALQKARLVLRTGAVSNNKLDGADTAVTDNGNYIVDVYFTEPIANVNELALQLKTMTGVLDHGLFVDMADILVVGMKDGSVRVINKGEKAWW
jgi:ribose 5-phosphate isomerase A